MRYEREARVRIRYFLRDKKAVARDSISGVKEGLCENLRYAKTRIRSQGERNFMKLEVFAGQPSPDQHYLFRNIGFWRLLTTHLYRIFSSTDRRSGMEPVYGEPGVDSSMKRPYSGWKVGTESLERGRGVIHEDAGLSRNAFWTYASPRSETMSLTIDWSFARISVWRRDSFAFLS